ncbi:winged helix-turn-helix domain-containing protein [Propionicimonas sp.]|uniref:winged helix-turn-helix domain-containing protein n=1 Tax=Propionicimonas sp. TaxID=1955623 RepID=UPI0039E38F75
MADGKTGEQAPRSVTPEALKAFAHPLRMALYSELQRRGAATASQLGRTLEESSGQTSYHLRQLERHGFVEDDPGHTGGRERWWRPVGFTLSDPDLQDPDTSEMTELMVRQAIAERAATLTSWLDHLAPVDGEPGLLSAATLPLTDSEAETLIAELSELLQRRSAEAKHRTPPIGARRFRVHLDVFPLSAGPAEA